MRLRYANVCVDCKQLSHKFLFRISWGFVWVFYKDLNSVVEIDFKQILKYCIYN